MEGQREIKLSMRRKLESFKSNDARMCVVTKNILNYNNYIKHAALWSVCVAL